VDGLKLIASNSFENDEEERRREERSNDLVTNSQLSQNRLNCQISLFVEHNTELLQMSKRSIKRDF